MSDLFLSDDVRKLLRGKHVVLLGDSNIRGIYKDIIWLMNDNSFIPYECLGAKGEPRYDIFVTNILIIHTIQSYLVQPTNEEHQKLDVLCVNSKYHKFHSIRNLLWVVFCYTFKLFQFFEQFVWFFSAIFELMVYGNRIDILKYCNRWQSTVVCHLYL